MRVTIPLPSRTRLARTSQEFNGRHLRVDIASGDVQYDPKVSVFVGQLPFDVTEEEVGVRAGGFAAAEHVCVIARALAVTRYGPSLRPRWRVGVRWRPCVSCATA